MKRLIQAFLATLMLYLWVGLPILLNERRELVSQSDGLSITYNEHRIIVTGEDSVTIRLNGRILR